jgi:hypothetical protein
MTPDEIINAWNRQADYMNKWDRLGEDEKLEWAMRLEREACAKVCEELEDDGGEWDIQQQCANAIRSRGQA